MYLKCSSQYVKKVHVFGYFSTFWIINVVFFPPRLSCIFGVDELGKYCYDFCKEAKMGHLIIASPYKEAARPIYMVFFIIII